MISPHAVVEVTGLPDDVVIHEFAVVRKGARLGEGVVVHPHVCIESGVTLGDGVEVFHGAVIGREPRGAGAVSRPIEFERTVDVGSNTVIGPHAVIYYDVRIGSETLIGDGASIRDKCRIGDRCLISRGVTFNYNTVVGNRVKVMDLAHITGNCVIEDDVFVSTLVATVNDNALGAHGYDEERILGLHVGSGAMIGAGAILLPSVRIGSGAIVGSGAVVTKDVAPRTLVMGMPARLVRSLDETQRAES
jgi:acetyltransferase-like isoleucine patch superfamily enzyme